MRKSTNRASEYIYNYKRLDAPIFQYQQILRQQGQQPKQFEQGSQSFYDNFNESQQQFAVYFYCSDFARVFVLCGDEQDWCSDRTSNPRVINVTVVRSHLRRAPLFFLLRNSLNRYHFRIIDVVNQRSILL